MPTAPHIKVYATNATDPPNLPSAILRASAADDRLALAVEDVVVVEAGKFVLLIVTDEDTDIDEMGVVIALD